MISRREQRTLAWVIILLVATAGLIWGAYSLIISTESDIIPRGRLHEDKINGSNKIYVENYGDKYNGCEIFVRVRLDEYFEYGKGAGTEGDKRVTVVRGGILNDYFPNILDVETWDAYDHYELMEDDVVNMRHFITLKFGGQTIYMPTFNKNYNSDETDVNESSKEYNLGQVLSRATAYPDLFNKDSDKFDKVEEHEAMETQVGTVITMKKWKELGYPVNANLWVYDTDGWAYWAAPLKPQTSTGLLLNKVVETYDINNEWYYDINPVMEYVVKGDWGNLTGKTSEAIILLDKISGGEAERK